MPNLGQSAELWSLLQMREAPCDSAINFSFGNLEVEYVRSFDTHSQIT